MVQSSSLGDVRCLNIWDASFLRLYIWPEVLYTIGVCGRWKNSQKSVLTSKLDAGGFRPRLLDGSLLARLCRTRSIGHPPDVEIAKKACLQASLTRGASGPQLLDGSLLARLAPHKKHRASARCKNSQKSMLTSKLDACSSACFFAVQIVSSILHNFLENSNMLEA